jgi:hypothetical protein
MWDCSLQFRKFKIDLSTKYFAFALNYNLTLFYIVILYALFAIFFILFEIIFLNYTL